jgi:hypothetical protein
MNATESPPNPEKESRPGEEAANNDEPTKSNCSSTLTSPIQRRINEAWEQCQYLGLDFDDDFPELAIKRALRCSCPVIQ